MFVEQWVYEYLRRPELIVVGQVLTDLSSPRAIDWVRFVPNIKDTDSHKKTIAPEIILGGGCETHAVGVYLNNYTDHLKIYGNYAASGLFVRFNSAVIFENMCQRTEEEFEAEAKLLGLPLDLSAGDIITKSAYGSAIVFNLSRDCGPHKCYRHKTHGWMLWVEPGMAALNLVETSEDELLNFLNEHASATFLASIEKDHVLSVARHLRENYEVIIVPESERIQMARDLINRVPSGSKFIIALDHDEVRNRHLEIVKHPHITRYTEKMRKLVSEFSYAEVVSFSDVLTGHDELQVGGNHYNRPVYLKFSEKLVKVLQSLSPRP